MGYTRYWERTSKTITQDFLDAVNEILADCERRGIIIKGWDGEGEPEVMLGRVAFNGNGETELDHESFVIDNIKDDFCFCKTARKPYDYAVREALKVAKEMGLVANVRSDGRNEKIISDSEYLNEEKKAISDLKKNELNQVIKEAVMETIHKMLQKGNIWVYRLEDGGHGLVEAESPEEAEDKVRQAYCKHGSISESTPIEIYDTFSGGSCWFGDCPDVLELYTY